MHSNGRHSMAVSLLSCCFERSNVGKGVDPTKAHLLIEPFEDLHIGDHLAIWQYGMNVPHCLQTWHRRHGI